MPDIFDSIVEGEVLPPLKPSDIQIMPDPARRWIPASAAQEAALNCSADVLMLGGAAGSLKTSTMLVDLIAERDYPRMRSYYFRRTYAELTGGDNAIDQSLQLFSQTGAIYNSSTHTWRWPSGAEFYFRHCQHEKDVHQYQSQAMTALAIDESTHWPEAMARYLITRNRSTDPNVKIRARLGTNPGGVGHKWHQKVFMNGVCPHCQPTLAPPQGELRWDARWSDGVPFEDPILKVKISASYILSNVRDHTKLGAAYIARLKMQSPATAKALLEGCWKIFEGQFFDVFEPHRAGMPMVIPRREIKEQWWWPRWVASDYGFSISVAAAHLLIHEPQSEQFPRGRVIIIDEDECQETAKTFARRLVNRWILDGSGSPIENRWMPWFLSPDSFNEDGQPFSLASQMNEVLKPYGVQFRRANNDRVGGAMKMYTGLETGELVICEECRHLVEALESRIHDPKNENDVLKVSGDPLDDHYDSGRYGYLSWETQRGVTAPVNIRIAERLEKLWDTDPTTAMHQVAKIQQEERSKGKPGVYSGAARGRMSRLPKK